MSSKGSYCLLLTATLTPGHVPYLLRTDVAQRANDYVRAVRSWLPHAIPIIFVENSNTHSEELIALLNQRDNNEYITFQSTVSHLGKGNGEMEIIDYAINHSKLIPQFETIVKVTGRHYIPNINLLIKSFIERDTYVMALFKDNLRVVDSRVIIAKANFYTTYFLPLSTSVNEQEGVYVEHIVARAIHRAMADGKQWRLPAVAPVFIGVSGSENLNYNNGFFRILKRNLVLNLTRLLLSLQ